MIHFVPAWYNPARPWYSTDDVWFQTTGSSEPDATVTQVKVFHQGAEDARLVVLNYAPSLRRFLHSQNIFDVPYWSFFDEVQGFEDDYTQPLDFLKLEWPEDASFFYNPFIVTVMSAGDLHARVYLAREGTLQSIRYYGGGMATVQRIFDDRGFLSSVLMFGESGDPESQYYLSRGGDVIVSEDVSSGRIDVLNNVDDRFKSASYDSWNDMMAEFLQSYLQRDKKTQDTVVLALSDQHNDLVSSNLTDQTLVLSRSLTGPRNASSQLLSRTGAVFTDAGQSPEDALSEDALEWATLPVLSLYPLERRPTFGASANESLVYVFLYADNITTEQLDYAIATSAMQLVTDEHTRLLVCTFRSQDVDYLQGIKSVIAGYQRLDLGLLEDDETARLTADVGAAEEDEKIQLTFVNRDADLIRTMTKSRVLVDLGERVNSRLAAEAVDAGVPQINRSPQELCTHLINGYVISDDSELPTALDYFLSGLSHWDQSLVQCRVLEDLFSAEEILGRWDLIKEVVAYAGPADRP